VLNLNAAFMKPWRHGNLVRRLGGHKRYKPCRRYTIRVFASMEQSTSVSSFVADFRTVDWKRILRTFKTCFQEDAAIE